MTDMAAVEKDVIEWYRQYSEPWFRAEVDDVGTSANYYAVPNYVVGPDGVALIPTDEGQRAFHLSFVDELKSRGWAGTEFLKIDVTVINQHAAFLLTAVRNFDVDGRSLDGVGVTHYSYLAGKTADGWRFLSVHVGE